MLGSMLPRITDADDYIAALSAIAHKWSLTEEGAEKLLGIYEKYLIEPVDQESDRAAAKLYMAVDMLASRTKEQSGDFEVLGLGEENLNALFFIKDILSCENLLSREKVQEIADTVQGNSLSEPIRIILARAVMDAISNSKEFLLFQNEVVALADFLIGCGEKKLDRFTVLVGEVRFQCRT